MNIEKEIKEFGYERGSYLNQEIRWWSLAESLVRAIISTGVIKTIGRSLTWFSIFLLVLWTARPIYLELKSWIRIWRINRRLKK